MRTTNIWAAGGRVMCMSKSREGKGVCGERAEERPLSARRSGAGVAVDVDGEVYEDEGVEIDEAGLVEVLVDEDD
jgi:hypothetical protein